MKPDHKPSDSTDPVRELRDRRHDLAARVGYEHFPSDTRYQLMSDEMEKALNRHPERAGIICAVLDSMTRLYEYSAILGNDPKYRHVELVDEVREALARANEGLLAIPDPLTPFDRELLHVSLALHLATEYLGKVHADVAPEQNLGLARQSTRQAVERVLGKLAHL